LEEDIGSFLRILEEFEQILTAKNTFSKYFEPLTPKSIIWGKLNKKWGSNSDQNFIKWGDPY
jgi:hypothetical protein